MKTYNITKSSKLYLICWFSVFVFQVHVFAEVSVREASNINDDTLVWMKKVADWQLTQSSWNSSVSWEKGALHTGMMACYEATKDEKYLEKCREWSEKFNWQLGWNNSNHADNMACGQTYLELYLLDEQNPVRYTDYKLQNDTFVNDPETFDCDNSSDSDQWWWCDALFMAPPALVRLSRIVDDPVYIQAMNKMWGDTQDCLYDTEEHLFFRDIGYLPPYNYNGKKVFWSRGNGWVIAGTARVLQFLPKDDQNRQGYITLLQEMSAKLADIQLEDGYWHSDLLSPERFDVPETSGTGFFTFGIAWGVNNGFLDETEYWDNVEAGWDALRAAVKPDGLLGWVQPVGADPRLATEYGTDVFGVGAYLLAGSEVYKNELAKDVKTIDCFEDYDSDGELEAVWQDGSVNGTGAVVKLGDYADNFMELAYDNSLAGASSEVTIAFDEVKDFTADDAYYLSVLVRGDENNNAEKIYVELEDAAGNTASQVLDDYSVVQAEKWMELGFKLAAFEGVDLGQISKLTIGAGGLDNGASTEGTIRVDNIRLREKQCLEAVEDINGDCVVNLMDFAEIAVDWNDFYGVSVEPVEPDTASLAGYWPFDDSYADASGNGHDGAGSAYVSFGGGKHGSALYFPGYDYSSYVVCDDSSDMDFANGLTVSAWIKSAGADDTWASIVTKGLSSWRLVRNNTTSSLSFHFNQAGGGEYQANGSLAVFDDQWHHVMGVYDGSSVRLYVDGVLDAEGGAGPVNVSSDPVYIGSRVNNTNNRNWIGYIDDVRLYNVALNENNLLYLADMPGYVEISEPQSNDIELDGSVDMGDLERLSARWLDNVVWPK